MIALYPGAFKPPHRGHFNVVKSLLDGSYNGTIYNKDDYKEKASSLFQGQSSNKPKIDKVIIFVGGGERNGIDKQESEAIWNIYKKYLGNVEIVDGQKNPMFAAKDYAREHPEDQFVAVTGIRGEEDFVDLRRVTTFNNVDNVQGLALASAPGSGIRATDFRKSILSGNLDNVIDFFPEDLSREEILNILNDLKDKIVAEILSSNIEGFVEGYFNENKDITYTNPNFDAEWEEAKRYPEFVEMGKEGWLSIAKKGKPVSYSSIKNNLGNVDLNFDSLEEPKKQRFQDAFKKGTIEMSIAVKFSDNDYDLVAGNTRLSGLVKNGIDPKIWIVDLSSINEGYVLQDLEDKFGIDLDLHDNGESLTLSRIVIPKDKRGEGIGTKVMNLIIQYADAQNKPIYLTPSKDFGASSVSRLEQFYKQFGFKKKDKSDFSTRETMVRLPLTDLQENYTPKLELKDYITSLTEYMLDIGMNIVPLPEVKLRRDEANASNFFGKTAYYDPNAREIVLYVTGRHDKDIVRSYSHEMIHHMQNLQGTLHNIQTQNTNEDDKLLELEKEAYLLGNITFRNWEDSLKNGEDTLNEDISKSELDAIEKYADNLFAKLGIDIEFTKHFLDRANDERNKKPITVPELIGMFKRLHKKHGKPLSKIDRDFDAVVKDFNNDINVPFAIDVTQDGIDMYAKTIMRKKDFKTSTPVYKL